MLVSFCIAGLWMTTAILWMMTFGLLVFFTRERYKLVAALLAMVPAAVPAATAIWLMS